MDILGKKNFRQGSRRIAQAAGILMATTVVSRILGYVRDMVIYASFGQNQLTDAYQAAFSIPDFLYLLLVGGALSSAFIPVFASYLARKEEEAGWEVANVVFNLVLVSMLAGITLGLLFTPQLIRLLVPGFEPTVFQLTVYLTRIMLAQAFFMALNGVSLGILNAHKHFLSPALGGIIYNLGIITVGCILSPYFGITGFAFGVVTGAAASFAVQIPALLRIGLRYRFTFNFRHPGVKQIGRLFIPVLLGLSVTQLNLFVNQNLASGLSPGSVAALRTAQRLMQLPIGIFAVAIAAAAFPTLTERAVRREQREFLATFSLALRSIIFITLPTAGGMAVLRVPIIRLLFEQGQFTPAATQATATALLFYCLGLFAYASLQLLNRAFYALQDTLTPVVISIATVGVNIFLNLALVGALEHRGLALAYSLAGIFNFLVLLFLLRQKLGVIKGRQLLDSTLKSLLATGIMGGLIWAFTGLFEANFNLTHKLYQVFEVGIAVGGGGGIYFGIATLLRLEEVKLIWQTLGTRLHRNRRPNSV